MTSDKQIRTKIQSFFWKFFKKQLAPFKGNNYLQLINEV